jgi:hypothetical protein
MNWLPVSLLLLVACGKTTIETGEPATTPPTTTPPPTTEPSDDTDGDGVADVYDCAPTDARVYAGAHEFCDGLDNDCDSFVDETFDLDADGFFAADEADCRAAGIGLDCDDSDGLVNPLGVEVCDGVDNDCSGFVDDARDGDGDGFGACEECDDGDPFIFPGQLEAHDGIDNDCSGLADEPWDGDGDGWSPVMGDCNDYDPYNSPGTPEICDGRDNDCDAIADEDFDLDLDGFTTCQGDCDDDNDAVRPDAEEICDDLDTDCDGVIQDRLDEDADGTDICAGDCDDLAPTVHVGAADTCNDVDDDCDGVADEDVGCWDCTTNGDRLYCEATTNWEAAVDLCDVFGGSLAVITSAEENTEIGDFAKSIGGSNPPQWWIGLGDAAVEGTYEWIDGTPLGFTGWASGQPNDVAGTANCVETNLNARTQATGQWNDESCTVNNPFVCELP